MRRVQVTASAIASVRKSWRGVTMGAPGQCGGLRRTATRKRGGCRSGRGASLPAAQCHWLGVQTQAHSGALSICVRGTDVPRPRGRSSGHAMTTYVITSARWASSGDSAKGQRRLRIRSAQTPNLEEDPSATVVGTTPQTSLIRPRGATACSTILCGSPGSDFLSPL
jgi:hypothetical protein